MTRHQLNDDQWECIKDLVPSPKATGRPPSEPRKVIDGILWILRTGAPWRDLPAEFGKWRTIYGLFDKWNGDGTIDGILNRLRATFFEVDEIDQDLWCIDGTVTRAHRCAAGGGKKTIQRNQLITH
jgi:transposase